MASPQEILKTTPFGAALTDATRRAIISRGKHISLRGGSALFLAGSQPDAVFLVLTGRLIVVREADDGSEDQVVGYLRAGEIVGEMSMLDAAPRAASAYALRDTELIELSASVVRRLMAKKADFAASVARTIVRRSRTSTNPKEKVAAKVFAIVATSPAVDPLTYTDSLDTCLSHLSKKTKVLREKDVFGVAGGEEALFQAAEDAADVLLLPCRIEDSEWYRFCLRHADRILLFVRRDARPPSPLPLTADESAPARRFRLVDLVALPEGQGDGFLGEWAAETGADRIFHWSSDSGETRIARAMSGRSLGLCLSGGGARAYAHFGVIKELARRGAPIDFIGGASMGAVIAACVAMGWSIDDIEARLRDAFVDSSPLSDHTLPVVALTRGEIVEERLEKHFGDHRIEDLQLPFFCVSSDLTKGVVKVHRRGLLRKALRASISLPGVLPPVIDGNRVLVDGAVLNNFPVDVMRTRHRGITIGVDVARQSSISHDAFVDPPGFIRWVRSHGLSSAPPIVSLLMRAATVGRPMSFGTEVPDILVAPDAPGVDLRDWKKFDVAVEEGARAGRAAFDAASWVLQPFCSETIESKVASHGDLTYA
ncbi:MAG: patatin-like phospholipase family protein [Pseudomonadota bacterium]